MSPMTRVFSGLTAVADLVNLGDAGPAALQRLVELTEELLDADGVTFAEYRPGGGRVIAATPAAAWSLGRPVNPAHQLAPLGKVPRPRSSGSLVDQVPPGPREELAQRGVRRVLAATAQAGGAVVGTIQAFFGRPAEPARPGLHGGGADDSRPDDASPDDASADDGSPDEAETAIIEYAAAAAAQLYLYRGGLPAAGTEPDSGAFAEAMVVLGPDGAVRSWNDAATAVLGRPSDQVVGSTFPFELVASGYLYECQTDDGRWVQALAADLPDGAGQVLMLRNVTKARRLAEDRELFIAVTSHELRTPVTVIKGYADTLVAHWDALDEPARRAAAQRLRERASDLAGLVDRMLTAVGDPSHLAHPPERFDLAPVLRSSVADLAAGSARVIDLDLPAHLPEVVGSPAVVPLILVELFTNAVKYSPPDSPIEIATVIDARSVGFQVADRGIGVAPDHLERAFDRFWQAETGDHRRYNGLGLGLYLVRQIVERHNGWVHLRAREHGGTVAEVRLPRADLPA